MKLTIKAGKIANRVSVGDLHDLSIEWFITHTGFPFYVIERVGDRFKINGAEKEAEDVEKKTGTPDETKQQKTPQSKSGGKREYRSRKNRK